MLSVVELDVGRVQSRESHVLGIHGRIFGLEGLVLLPEGTSNLIVQGGEVLDYLHHDRDRSAIIHHRYPDIADGPLLFGELIQGKRPGLGRELTDLMQLVWQAPQVVQISSLEILPGETRSTGRRLP